MPSSGIYSTLSSYRTDVMRLLRDANNSLYTVTDLNSFINRAIRQRDLDLGMTRLRMQMTLVSGTYDYSFADVIASGTVLQGNTGLNIQTLLSIIVIPMGSSTSAVRYPLSRWPYTRLAPLLSTSYPTYPAAYAFYGPTTVMMGPPPAGNYISEWDFLCYNPDLVNDADQDAMPYPYTDPVPFLASSFAKLQAQRFDEAAGFERVYNQSMARVRGRANAISVANPWSDFPVR